MSLMTSQQRDNVAKVLEKEFWEKNEQAAVQVIAGHWGNGAERRKLLEEAGYNYDAVQAIVNELLSD